MGRVLRYVSREKKTMDQDGRRYLSGVNCSAALAQQSFMATKHLYGHLCGAGQKWTGTFSGCEVAYN